jgi:hypothetical protein
LIKDGVVDQEHISAFYLHRLQDIWNNDEIIEGKLDLLKVTYWSGFIEVSQILGTSEADNYAGRLRRIGGD